LTKGKAKKTRILIAAILLTISFTTVLSALAYFGVSWPSQTPVKMMLAGGGDTQSGSSSIHVADTWQEWYDADSGQQLVTNGVTGINLFSLFQTTGQPAPTKGFILRVPVKLAINLPEGFLIDQGTVGIATCAVSSVPTPACAFTVVQYSVALTVSVNGQVIQVIDPGVIGNPTFNSIQDKQGAQKDIGLFVWLQGSTPVSQATMSNFVNSLCFGACSLFNTNLLTTYVDLRSAVSQYQTTSFTVSVGIVEHWRAFSLYVSTALLPQNIGFNLGSYLTSPVSTVDVDNRATGPAWFTFTATAGLSGLPTGTFATFTAPTRYITSDTAGNVVVVVTATTIRTTGPGYVAGFNETGYTVTVMKNPSVPPIECALLPWPLEWLLCESTWGIANWLLVLVGIVVLILLIWGLAKLPRKHRKSSKSSGGRRSAVVNINIKRG
jgi:hypothetical protein